MPLSTDTDKDAFGYWLSGFTDGEGCFLLHSTTMKHNHNLLRAKSEFLITLRADDFVILNSIQSYLQCGNVKYLPKAGSYSDNGKPQYRFAVTKLQDLVDIIIPHFIKYPLQSKKASDFVIWQEGVILHHHIASRGRNGHKTNWTTEEATDYAIFVSMLRENRAYVPPNFS